MNPISDMNNLPAVEKSDSDQDAENHLPPHWSDALLTLVSSRISLIQLESKEAAKDGARRAIHLIAIMTCLFFTWALVLAGGIAAISKAAAWPWHWIALAAAAPHLLAAIFFGLAAKSKCRPPFPVTRAEFQKDREWIHKIKTTRKSND